MNMTITPAEMKQLEQRFMTEYGVPGALLMERAAQGVADALLRHVPAGSRVLFLCGPGNNGGDGFAAARLWQAQGGESIIWALTNQYQGDALMNYRLAELAGIPIHLVKDSLPVWPACLAVVDALFGTGLSRMIDGPAAEIIRAVNEHDAIPVIAVDIPSGIDGETGDIRGMEAIRAAETVTFHRIKPGLLLLGGPFHAGKITVQSIGIPDSVDPFTEGLAFLQPEDLSRLIPPRPIDCHKGDFGRAVIFAGSPGMAGAAAFCAAACVKAGAGLTTILCRESLLPILQTLVPEAMCRPLPEQNGALLPEACDIVRDALSLATAACIGCGLGQGLDLLNVLRVFRQADCPVVWDADALNLLARHDGLLPLHEQDVITPHPGEAARLLEMDTEDVVLDPLAALDGLHELCGCTVLLKGERTLISDGLFSWVNLHGSPALAKGGSGDVLAGVITALLARDSEFTTVEAAALGAMIHGLAGIRAAGETGENSLTPQRLIQAIRLDDTP